MIDTDESQDNPHIPQTAEGSEPTTPGLVELDEVVDISSEIGGEEGPKPIVPLKDVAPEIAALGVHTFEDLPINKVILTAIDKIGWKSPTPVQKLCLPYSLRGRDVAGFAQTGTGKTAVFLITILNRLLADTDGTQAGERGRVPRAIVIAPTRELAMQGEQDASELFQATGIKSIAVFGGIDYEKQAREIKEGVDVIFATPGRLKDYIQKKVVRLEDITVFVCDEADRMFDMGFIEDVEFFLSRIPEKAQRLLFSATTNDQVKELAFEYLETPEYISVNPEIITPERIEQHALHCHATDKLKVLLGMLAEHNPDCAVIFTNTKLTAEWLYFKLSGNGIDADLISGDLPQKKRISLIHRIKEGKIKALVATDVASRGLHISRITHVYNFDLPDDAANYVHRIGRTARAGAKGYAYSLVCDDYGQNLTDINSLLGPLALHTEWPKDDYLQIVDKAGNPFEERYARKAAEKAAREQRYPKSREAGPQHGGDRPDRSQGQSQGQGRPASDRPDRQGQSQGGSGSRSQQRPRHDAPVVHKKGDPRPPFTPTPGESQFEGGEGADPKRRSRRRRGGKGQGQEGGPRGENDFGRGNDRQQGGQGSGRGPYPPSGGGRGQADARGGQTRQGQGRGGEQNPNRDHAAAAAQPPSSPIANEAAPKTMGGMIKKLVKTIFGLGK